MAWYSNVTSGGGIAMWPGANGPLPCESGSHAEIRHHGASRAAARELTRNCSPGTSTSSTSLSGISSGGTSSTIPSSARRSGARWRRDCWSATTSRRGRGEATAQRARLELRLHHRRLPAQPAAGGVLPGKLRPRRGDPPRPARQRGGAPGARPAAVRGLRDGLQPDRQQPVQGRHVRRLRRRADQARG
jgi:hypothetical protein